MPVEDEDAMVRIDDADIAIDDDNFFCEESKTMEKEEDFWKTCEHLWGEAVFIAI